jgi:mannosyltransferase
VTATRAWLAVILAAGALLRAWGIGDHGPWIDEYGTAWTAQGGPVDCFDRALRGAAGSPLYYWIVQLSQALFGPGVLALRLPSLLFGVGLLALIQPLALRLFRDPCTALLCVAAAAVNERLVFASQDARPYGLALLATVGSFLCFAIRLDGGGRRALVGWCAASAVAWYAHYLFGLVVVVQAVVLLLGQARGRVRLGDWIAPFGVLALLMAPGLLHAADVVAGRTGYDWIEEPSGLVAGLGALVSMLDPALLAAAGVALGVVWLAERRLAAPAPRARWRLVALWLVVPVVLIVVVAPWLGVRLLHERYLLMAVPAAALVHGALLGFARGGPWLRALPVALFVLASLVLRVEPLLGRDGGRYWWYLQQDWEAAVAELVRAYRPGDLILHRTGFVELDAVVRGEASEATTEFVDWPLLAHLPARDYRRHPLPYRDSPELGAIVAREIERAAPRRIWLLGLDPDDPTSESFAGLVAMANHGARWKPVRHKNFGVVHLALLAP